MRLILDTNIIISALIKDAVTRNIIIHLDAELITIGFSDTELNRYKSYILKKAKITDDEFYMILDSLMSKIIVIDDRLIMTKMKEARKIMSNIDLDDTPFIAAALATNADVWSDDKHFNKQKKIKIWKTQDLIEHYERI